MTKAILGLSGAALALSLAACGTAEQPGNNVAATENLSAMTNAVEPPPAAPAANAVAEPPAAEEAAPAAKPAPTPKPAAAKPAAAKPATAAPKPAAPKPAEPKVAEPKPADPTCTPEHRAAGHC